VDPAVGAVSVSLRGEDGVVLEEKWAAGAPGLGIARTVPWRTFRWRHGQRHYSGTYWSSVMRGHVIHESRLELTRLLKTRLCVTRPSGPSPSTNAMFRTISFACSIDGPRSSDTFLRTSSGRAWSRFWRMVIAAFVVAVVSALTAVYAVVYARRQAGAADRSAVAAERSALAAERSAVASEGAAALEAQRRLEEMTPRFRVSYDWETDRLTVLLLGPLQLERLDSLTVRIRDDHPWRAGGTPIAGGPTAEQVAAQIWGPYRFIPGAGPGADPLKGTPGADPTGRVTPTRGMPVGESLQFALEPTRAPQWSAWSAENWRARAGTVLRLQLESRREGWEPWLLPCEINTSAGTSPVEVP
jgi:hypothetical protein